MIYGTIGRVGEIFSINSYMIDVENGAQVRSATSDHRGDIEDVLVTLTAQNAYDLLGISAPDSLKQSYIVLDVNPNRARISLDGQTVLPGTISVKPDRSYELKVLLRGYHTYAANYRVDPGQTLKLNINLERDNINYTGKINYTPQLPRKVRGIYISPRIGASNSSGVLGLEAQVKNFAASFGYAGVDWDYIFYGMRWYFSQDTSSWYAGVWGYQDDDDYTGQGLLFGYRWRAYNSFEFSLGFGYGEYDGLSESYSYSYDRRGNIVAVQTSSTTENLPAIDLALGFYF